MKVSVADTPDAVAAVAAVVRAVRERGVGLRLDGDVARMTLDGISFERSWVYRTRSDRLADRKARRGPPEGALLLLTDRMATSDAAEAKARGLWFADAAGRMHVRAPGVLIDIGNPRGGKTSSPGGRAQKTTNLMSPARAQVVFCLLTWPHMTQAPIRQLARTAGVSVGLAQQVMTALGADKYLTVGNERLLHGGELLDQWTAAFGLGLARRLELGRFVGEPTARKWADAGHVVYLGGEAAVPDQLRGGDLTLYVPQIDTRAAIASGWRRAEPQAPADIVVRRQFWTDPEAVEDLPATEGQVRRAPLPLVYADLVASGEPRQREVARTIREQLVALLAR